MQAAALVRLCYRHDSKPWSSSEKHPEAGSRKTPSDSRGSECACHAARAKHRCTTKPPMPLPEWNASTACFFCAGIVRDNFTYLSHMPKIPLCTTLAAGGKTKPTQLDSLAGSKRLQMHPAAKVLVLIGNLGIQCVAKVYVMLVILLLHSEDF